MIQRHHEFRIEDILDRIRRITFAEAQLSAAEGKGQIEYAEMAFDAILYDLLAVGEAIKSLDDEMKNRNANIKWKEIIGLRDFLAHQYFQIEVSVIKASIDQPLEDVRLACLAEQQR